MSSSRSLFVRKPSSYIANLINAHLGPVLKVSSLSKVAASLGHDLTRHDFGEKKTPVCSYNNNTTTLML